MSATVVLRPKAVRDLESTHKDLEKIRIGLGLRFLAQVRELLDRLEDHPSMDGVVWRDVRAARLKSFRYIEYYVVLGERVEVIAILHGSRNERAWKNRV